MRRIAVKPAVYCLLTTARRGL